MIKGYHRCQNRAKACQNGARGSQSGVKRCQYGAKGSQSRVKRCQNGAKWGQSGVIGGRSGSGSVSEYTLVTFSKVWEQLKVAKNMLG